MASDTATSTVSLAVGLGAVGAEDLDGCGDGKSRRLSGDTTAAVGTSEMPVAALAAVEKPALESKTSTSAAHAATLSSFTTAKLADTSNATAQM
jgi:hypothetical protein